MEYGPELPTVEREIFANPPLKAMLGQVRFPPILRIADVASLGGFQDAIRADWPEFAQEQQISFMIGPEGPQAASASKAYRFTSADRVWSVLLSPDALTVEAALTGKYTRYEEFAERFRGVWSTLLEHFRPTQVLRQGLRYVDHLEGELAPAEWRMYINEELLGPLTGPLGMGIDQSVSELRFRRPDGALVFKHGVLPAGPEAKIGYLLDFDYFNEDPSDDVTADAVGARFDTFHEVLHAFFRWCVTEKALEEFRHGS